MKQKDYILTLSSDGAICAVIDLREVAYVMKNDKGQTIVSFKNKQGDISFSIESFDVIAKAFIEYNSYKESAE